MVVSFSVTPKEIKSILLNITFEKKIPIFLELYLLDFLNPQTRFTFVSKKMV